MRTSIRRNPFALNIIRAPSRVSAVLAGTLVIILFTLTLTLAAHAQQVPQLQDRDVEELVDRQGALGRRANPTRRQIEWRRQAGLVDIKSWPSELMLREINPLLHQFFGAIQGREFDQQQVASVFAGSFEGTRIGEAKSIRTGSGALLLTSWSLSDGPTLDRVSFAANWQQHYQVFGVIIRTEHHVDRFETLGDGLTRRLTIPFRVTGYLENNLALEDQGTMLIDVRRDATDSSWRIVSVDLLELESLQSPTSFSTVALAPSTQPVDAPLAAFVEYFAQGVSVLDLDGDQDLDLFAASKSGRPKVFRNEGERQFTEVGELLGFGAVRDARSGYFFDWDNDGDEDALIITSRRMHLLESRDGLYHDISAASGFDRMSTTGLTSATIADYDNDGFLDFYVTNYGDLSQSPVADYFDSNRGFKNQLFHNSRKNSFQMITQQAGLDLGNTRWSFSALSFDYDGDGWQDIYVINDYGPNQLFRNRGSLVFENMTDVAGVTDFGNGMAASLGDLNNDGHQDIYVSNMISHAGKRIADSKDFAESTEARQKIHRFSKGNTLLLGRPGGFAEAEPATISDAKWAWGNTLFDYDNDGDLDIYVANGMYSNLGREDTDPVFWRHLLAPISGGKLPGAYASNYFAYLIQQESQSFAGYERNRLFQNFGDGEFRDVAFTVGADLVLDSRSVVAADVDNDGMLDVVVANRNDPGLVVLWNELPDAGNFVEIRLVGTVSNRDGVGAKVSVRCGKAIQERIHQAGSGYLSQGPHTVWFGLGACQKISELRVRWPSGLESVVHDVSAGSRVQIIEE